MPATPKNFDWQGHRGARGLMPENTVPAFLEALKYPVVTLELDVVISRDRQIVVSHEPWMNPAICLGPDGQKLPQKEDDKHNIYLLSLEEIRHYDCGSIGNAQFRRQQKIAVAKPTLAEVVHAVADYCMANSRSLPAFNIELKSREPWYDVYVPRPEEFVKILLAWIDELGISERTTLQSFDLNVLRELKKQIQNDIQISYLVERNLSIENAIELLGFTPHIYSPHHRLVKAETIGYAHEHGIRVIPWTVNTVEEFKKLIEMGVDGLITDYPDLIASANTDKD